MQSRARGQPWAAIPSVRNPGTQRLGGPGPHHERYVHPRAPAPGPRLPLGVSESAARVPGTRPAGLCGEGKRRSRPGDLPRSEATG